MTNHMVDLRNTDVCFLIGSNMAENHPIGIKWLLKGKETRGNTIINVDPRYTRTSKVADIYAPMRSGTDIAFMGGMINYILQNDLYHREYIQYYTNAPFLVREEYEFNDGLFNGYDGQTRIYDGSTWDYQLDGEGNPVKDMTLENPRSVFQLMKEHYSRYDIDTVCAITGTPRAKYLEVLETFCATGAPDKVGTICYAMGTTQQSKGSQNVRSYAVVQLLLGNMGRPGGGTNALRGENNVQGATDYGNLFHILPGYLGSPVSTTHPTYERYLEVQTPASGYWVNTPKFMASLLKAWWRDEDPAVSYNYIPKREGAKDYSFMNMFENMYKGEIDGLFVFGTNPMVGGPNTNKEQRALANLKWMVQSDLWFNETSEFWSYQAFDRPTAKDEYGLLTPPEIQTEVFFLPACGVYEKEGTASQTGRWVQYRWQAALPAGESDADLYIYDKLAKAVKKQYEGSTRPEDEPITRLTWDYVFTHDHTADIAQVDLEINGYYVDDPSRPVEGFPNLQADGSTACGCWVYCGMLELRNGEVHCKPKNRDNRDTSVNGLGIFANWAWSWPLNRRIVYNRCSVQPDGVTPWPGDEKRVLIQWNAEAGRWMGDDVPDFGATVAPDAPGGTNAFIMLPEGVGRLFATKGSMREGPFPEHYEPWESPTQNVLSSQQVNPMGLFWEPEKQGRPEDYPLVGTTYRVVEHWQSGALTRNQPWLSEAMPHMFVEISEQLAFERGIKNKDQIIVSTSRGEIKAYAMVTKRLRPMMINGRETHQIGMLWHFGYKGYSTGDPANRLTAHVGCPNSRIPEYKAFLCDIRRA